LLRRGFKHVRLLFTGDHLTRYGGVFLLHRFFRRLGLRRRFQVNVHFAQRNNTSSIPEMLLALLDPIILGLGRLDATDLLRRNGVFQALTGLPAYPNPVTCGGSCADWGFADWPSYVESTTTC